MTLEAIQQICKSFEEVTEDIKWEEHLCFNVGGKMFLITSPDLAPVTASFKVSAEDFDLLIEREGFKEWKILLQSAYELVKAKLRKKRK